MNLIKDPWIPVIRQKARTREYIRPHEITDNLQVDPLEMLDAPRYDFNGSLYQLFIGLIQTIMTPEDEDEWVEGYSNPPSPTELKKKMESLHVYFELDGPDIRFMQDMEIEKEKPIPISSLFIEQPGANPILLNTDHFIKRNTIEKTCERCTAMALYTLQTNAPSGGAGHRTSLRGGGPLTTLAEPNAMDTTHNTLWHRTWLNVLIKDNLKGTLCNSGLKEDKFIFPWITQIKTSKDKGSETTGNDINPLQTYWATPRRIQLEEPITQDETCDICGETGSYFYTHYQTRPHGINYSEGIIHPLSPYYKDTNGNLLPVHPQPGGFTYRHWPAYVTSMDPERPRALNIRYLDDRLYDIGNRDVEQHIRVFGYDMDKMKARCWYETRMPYWTMPAEIRDEIVENSRMMADTARQIASNTRSSVKEAWFDPKRTVRGDISFIETEFWSSTEKEYYRKVKEIQNLLENDENTRSVLEEWLSYLNRESLNLFDFYSEQIGLDALDDRGVPRIISARSKLMNFNTGKKVRKLLQLPESIKA